MTKTLRPYQGIKIEKAQGFKLGLVKKSKDLRCRTEWHHAPHNDCFCFVFLHEDKKPSFIWRFYLVFCEHCIVVL